MTVFDVHGRTAAGRGRTYQQALRDFTAGVHLNSLTSPSRDLRPEDVANALARPSTPLRWARHGILGDPLPPGTTCEPYEEGGPCRTHRNRFGCSPHQSRFGERDSTDTTARLLGKVADSPSMCEPVLLYPVLLTDVFCHQSDPGPAPTTPQQVVARARAVSGELLAAICAHYGTPVAGPTELGKAWQILLDAYQLPGAGQHPPLMPRPVHEVNAPDGPDADLAARMRAVAATSGWRGDGLRAHEVSGLDLFLLATRRGLHVDATRPAADLAADARGMRLHIDLVDLLAAAATDPQWAAGWPADAATLTQQQRSTHAPDLWQALRWHLMTLAGDGHRPLHEPSPVTKTHLHLTAFTFALGAQVMPPSWAPVHQACTDLVAVCGNLEAALTGLLWVAGHVPEARSLPDVLAVLHGLGGGPRTTLARWAALAA